MSAFNATHTCGSADSTSTKIPAAQGYSPGSFDIIVSANVVHASKNARLALRRLHDLLAPAGLLILIESTTHFIWFDMTTGLIEGWQHFDDDLRSDNPLLAADKWVEVLLDAGFEEADSWPGCDSCARHLGQHVLVARVAGEPAPETGTGELPRQRRPSRDPGAR